MHYINWYFIQSELQEYDNHKQQSPISFDCDVNGVAPTTDRRGMLDKMAFLHMPSTGDVM